MKPAACEGRPVEDGPCRRKATPREYEDGSGTTMMCDACWRDLRRFINAERAKLRWAP